jgi:hypothetical protein
VDVDPVKITYNFKCKYCGKDSTEDSAAGEPGMCSECVHFVVDFIMDRTDSLPDHLSEFVA